MTPTAERFRALARSSPWWWRSAQFTARWHGPELAQPVRAWIRRGPDSIRVKTLDGELITGELPATSHA